MLTRILVAVVVTSNVDPEQFKQDIVDGKIDVAQIAALAAGEYRVRFGHTGHSTEVAARLEELDRLAATASPHPKALAEKPPVVEDPSKLIQKPAVVQDASKLVAKDE